jgi:hypothetical protein
MSGRPVVIESLIRARLRPEEKLYAVLDAARQPSALLEYIHGQGLPSYSLFSGRLARRLDHVAPFLVAVGEDPGFLSLWEEYFGENYGVLLLSGAPTGELWRHLRGLFVSSDEDGNEYFFRFYDPRVLDLYLPTCTPHDLSSFLGPVGALFTATRFPGMVLCVRRSLGGVVSERFLVTRLSEESVRIEVV